MNNADALQKESIALKSIIGGPTKPFFDDIWQEACVLYKNKIDDHSSSETIAGNATQFDIDKVKASPYQELLRHGWSSLVQLLESARDCYSTPDLDATRPLLFQNRETVPPETYNESLFHAYLDGASVVLNHADERCPYLAALCEDLQESLPHAYANTYLTPPDSQAVPPHSDDRDVLILQIHGSKRWKIYKSIPVPFPYPHEQVGKDGIPVPPQVLEGELLMDCVLEPGHVLYMPRGYVHQASTLLDTPSYHVTVALATHDWTLAGLLTTATQHTLSGNIAYRQSLPVHLGRSTALDNETNIKTLQEQLDAVWEELKERITAEKVINNFAYRCESHNRRVGPVRQALMNKAASEMDHTNESAVGPKAASSIQLSTFIRAATPEEKASVAMGDANAGQQSRGLHVREATGDAIMSILTKLKTPNESGVLATQCRVGELKSLVEPDSSSPLVCDLTLLSFAKVCVELGALAVVS
jgi:hypothetical protein